MERTMHVLAPAHVTHPWKYRQDFYAGEEHAWLDCVHEEAVRVVLTVREEVTGRIIASVPLQDPLVHPNADLSVYGMGEAESAHLATLESLVLPLELVPKVEEGMVTVLVGNDKVEESLEPCWLNGVVEGVAPGPTSDSEHVVVQTGRSLSVMGMCGGPAVVHPSPESGPMAAGLIFARVDSGPLKGRTMLVSSGTIQNFLATVVEKQ
jgi:hypothetical protein